MDVVERWRRAPADVLAALAWLLLVAAAVLWGRAAVAGDPHLHVGAAPLVGRWVWHAGRGLVPAIIVAAAAVLAAPRVAASLRWRYLIVLTGVAAAAWATVLAAADGWSHLAVPLESRYEYVPFAATIEDPVAFVRTFTERAHEYPVHVKGHPPGATLAFWLLDRAGLGGGGWAATLVIGAWAVGIAAVLVAIAELAGEGAARRASPFLALSPAVIWVASTADALFAGVAASGIALLVVATGAAHRATRSGVGLSFAGGAVLAVALHLTYGAALLLTVPAAVVAWRRRWDVVAPAIAGAALVTALALSAGFWWGDGLSTTAAAYWDGVASRRPWAYHLLAGNPAALALATGPALFVAAGHMRRRAPGEWLLAAAAAAALAVANLSNLSRGEVERIWLPFVPWLTSVAHVLAPRAARWWLAAQVGVALLLQAWLRTPW